MKSELRPLSLLISIAIGFGLWLCPVPEGLPDNTMHLVGIFIGTIAGIISKALPMGSMTLLALAVALMTKTLDFKVAFSGFCHSVVWLIVLAFFVARGFSKTGLGMRIGYLIVGLLGKRSLGLGYGLAASELLLAPAIPSMTARAGGVIYPIVTALSNSFGSSPEKGTSRKIGSYLIMIAIQSNIITSAMFLTAAAPNPLIASLAGGYGIGISWGSWALAALVPGLVSLLFMPWFLMKIYPPEIKKTPEAALMAKEKLREMGPVSIQEWIMLGTFILLLALWIFGEGFGIDATLTALIGLVVLLLSGVLNWNDIISEKAAWDTLVWFSALIALATELSRIGFTSWLGSSIVPMVQHYSWPVAFLILSLVYFYSHYFFASALAHVAAMYGAFLAAAMVLGAPPLFAALFLAFLTSLFGALTHYASGPAAVLYASQYVPMNAWWRNGLLISVVNIAIWLVVGGVWWSFLGII